MPLVGISLSFLLGIIVASLLSLPAWIWFAISVSIVILLRLLPDRFSQFIVRPLYFAILLAFLLGAWRYRLRSRRSTRSTSPFITTESMTCSLPARLKSHPITATPTLT